MTLWKRWNYRSRKQISAPGIGSLGGDDDRKASARGFGGEGTALYLHCGCSHVFILSLIQHISLGTCYVPSGALISRIQMKKAWFFLHKWQERQTWEQPARLINKGCACTCACARMSASSVGQLGCCTLSCCGTSIMSLFQTSFSRGFTKNMKLEAVNPRNPGELCVASVVRVKGRLLWLHLEGMPAL